MHAGGKGRAHLCGMQMDAGVGVQHQRRLDHAPRGRRGRDAVLVQQLLLFPPA
jgi:hypothetical protein